MENNRFFTLVWRFNGLVISITGVLAIGVLAFVSYKLILEITRERNIVNNINISPSNETETTWQLGYPSTVEGTPYVIVPLTSDQYSSHSYYSKSSSSARNYLFINTEDNIKQWLFNHNNHLIERREMLRKDQSDHNSAVTAILFQLIKSDSNHDGKLTIDDQKTIAIVKPDGSHYTELFSPIDIYVGSQLVRNNKLLIIYQRQGTGYSAFINLFDFKVENETELPKVGL